MKKFWLIIVSLLNTVATGIYIMSIKVDKIPTHFNVYGEADSYGSKWSYLFISLIPVALAVFYEFYKVKTKNNEKIKKNRKYENRSIPLMTFFFIAVSWCLIIFATSKSSYNFLPVVTLLLALLFIYISNLFGKIQQNSTFGIKTHCTLSSETVWKKTHKLGGYLGVISGFVLAVTSIIALITQKNLEILCFGGMIVFLICSVIIPIIYAQVIYSKEQKAK